MDLKTIFISISIAIVAYKIIIQILWPQKAKSPPRVKSWLPVPLGAIIGFSKPVQFIFDSMKNYGLVFTAHILGKEMTFINDPELLGSFFGHDDSVVSQKEVYKFMTPVFGKGVVYDAKSQQRMTEQLHFVMSGLRTQNFRRFVQIFEDEAALLMKKMGDEGEFNLFDMFSKLIIFTASRSLLGDSVREYLEDKDMAKLYKGIDDGISPISFFFPNLPTLSAKSRNDSVKQVYAIFKDLMKYKKEHPDEDTSDVLGILMRSKYRNGKKVPVDHICGIMLAGLFAGQHTSSITSTWTLLSVLNDKKLLNRVLEEQKEVLDHQYDKLTFDKVQNMTLLRNCMNEALRMYPPLIMLMRYCKKSVKCGDYVIPKGNVMVVSTSVLGRSESIYTNPNKFDPDRFERNEHQKYKHSDILFGSGRHRCLGENFARLQVTSLVSILLRNYEMELVTPFEDIGINYHSLVCGPEKSPMVRYKKRTSW